MKSIGSYWVLILNKSTIWRKAITNIYLKACELIKFNKKSRNGIRKNAYQWDYF